jgi:hypothetical protein
MIREKSENDQRALAGESSVKCRRCSSSLFFALPGTFRKTTYLFVRIIGKAKQGHSSKQYAEPSQAENDPK